MPRLPSLALALSLAATTALAAPYKAPRTPFGAPDLQGVWTNTSATFLQRPPLFKTLVITPQQAALFEANFAKFIESATGGGGDPKAPAPKPVKEVANSEWVEMDMHMAAIDGQVRSSWIVDPADGRLPFTDAGRKATKAAEDDNYDGPEGRPTAERCLTAIGSPEGPPMMNTGYNANYQIIQTRDTVAILVEMNHDVRIIRLGDRRHLPASVTPWMGDSVGWWEGDTLVVETTNLNPKGAYIGSLGGGFAYSPAARITERFTRTAKDRILYDFTVDDPAYFTRTWRAQIPMRPAPGPIYEYACHEGNYSLPNALSGARAEERAAAAATATAPNAARP